MAISDAEYLDWLQTQNVFRCVLIEYNYLEEGVLKNGYAANHPFVSKPTDSPANIAYDDVLVGDIDYRRSIGDSFDGGANINRGEVVLLITPDTENLLFGWFNFQSINIYIGSPEWDRNDFRKIVSGVIKNKSVSRNKVVLLIRDDSELFNVYFQQTIYSTGDAEGKNAPLCFGNCFNVSPLLIESSISKYQVHDGAIEDIVDVRDNGVSVGFTKDLSTGTFTLMASPSGQITADIKGAKPTSGTVTGYKNTPCEIIKLLIGNYSNFNYSNIDSDSFDDLEIDAPYECGLYIVNEKFTIIEAINMFSKSIGAYWFVNRLGKFKVGRIDLPTTADKQLYDDEIKNFGIDIKKIIEPLTSVKLGYKKNWTQQNNIAGSVSEANRALYSKNYQLSIAEDLTILSDYPDAKSGEEIETLLFNKTDSDAEASRRIALVKTPRTVYEVSALAAAFNFSMGETVEIFYSGLGFSDGLNTKIISSSEKIGLGSTVLEVWN
jgi:hypothetical protein